MSPPKGQLKRNERSPEHSALGIVLGAIIVSPELSRSNLLITSLSSDIGEKLSKYSIPTGDAGVRLARLTLLRPMRHL